MQRLLHSHSSRVPQRVGCPWRAYAARPLAVASLASRSPTVPASLSTICPSLKPVKFGLSRPSNAVRASCLKRVVPIANRVRTHQAIGGAIAVAFDESYRQIDLTHPTVGRVHQYIDLHVPGRNQVELPAAGAVRAVASEAKTTPDPSKFSYCCSDYRLLT